MSLKDFVKSRLFLKHFAAATLLVFVLLLVTMLGLKIYTRHGQSTPVPDLTGLTVDQLEDLARKSDLKFEIIDSVFVDDAQPGSVVDQEPESGIGIKANHIIYLTINAIQPEKVILPKLTDISFRQVLVLAENCGIVIGGITYEPSEFNDLVLSVEQDSVPVMPGDLVLKGSRIDLIVGRQGGAIETTLPDLSGASLAEAREMLTIAMLNTGVVIYDETVLSSEDSVNAVIWKQYPSIKNTKYTSSGTSVDLWFTTDTLKIERPVLNELQ